MDVTASKFIVDGVEYFESEALSSEGRLLGVNLNNNLLKCDMLFELNSIFNRNPV